MIIKTDAFAHMVTFVTNEEYEISDNYFDMMPMEEKRITITTNEVDYEFIPEIYTINGLRNTHKLDDYKKSIY